MLAAIWGGGLLSPASRDFALGLLERQRPTSKLPISLPPGARFLHKTGDLEGVENDAGLVVHPAGAFALAVLTFGDLGEAATRIGAAVSELCRAFGIAPTGAQRDAPRALRRTPVGRRRARILVPTAKDLARHARVPSLAMHAYKELEPTRFGEDGRLVDGLLHL